MNIQELIQFKDQHGRIRYTNKLGEPNTLFGYIREVNCDHIVWQDTNEPDKFKIRNVISFDLIDILSLIKKRDEIIEALEALVKLQVSYGKIGDIMALRQEIDKLKKEIQ